MRPRYAGPMSRIPPLDPAAMTDAQRQAHDAIAAGKRGGVYGPLAVWVHQPGLAQPAQALGQYCRYDSALAPRLSELAILLTARHWGAEFEWYAHVGPARAAGIAESLIEAIRTGAIPVADDPEQQAVIDVTTTLYRQRRLPPDLYARAERALGRARLIDLVGILGYYALISMTINAFEVGLPPGAEPSLDAPST